MPDLFMAILTSLYIKTVPIEFTKVVGITIPIIKVIIGAGNPESKAAALKKTIPLIKVPVPPSKPTTKELMLNLLRYFIKTNITNDATSLSIILGICPPGKDVVIADNKPPKIPVNMAFSNL